MIFPIPYIHSNKYLQKILFNNDIEQIDTTYFSKSKVYTYEKKALGFWQKNKSTRFVCDDTLVTIQNDPPVCPINHHKSN